MIEEMIEETINPLETKVEKWSSECLSNGFKFLGKSSDNPNYSLTECLTCGHVDTYQQINIRKGNVRCENCKITQWSRECLANGFKFIEKVDNRNSLTECLTCGHVDTYQQGAIRNGNVRCENCKNTQWTRECLANGLKFLGKSSDNPNYSIAECLTCGHVDTFRHDTIRNGEVRCENCKFTQWTRECLTAGFKFLKKVDGHYSLTECLTCGHVDTYKQGNIRKGNVKCESCLVNKYKSLVKSGWKYVDKTVIKNKTHVILTHHCSDNLITVQSGAFLDGSYDCPHCSQTHFDEPSNFYVIKVTHNNSQLIKIGVANNTDKRFGQYGLPDDAVIEIIHVKPFDTKRLAIIFETMVKESVKEYKLDDDIAKSIFTKSGHTEVFSTDSLDIIRQLI